MTQQQTLGIISSNIKDDILNKISTFKIKLVYEKQFDLNVETSLEILNKSISKTLPVYGFILEGSNAIKDWSQIASTATLSKRRSTFIYASTTENAQHQVDWFKNLVLKDLSIEKNTSTSSIPIKVNKKQLQQQQQQKPKSVNVSDASSQRKPLRSSTIAQQQQKFATSRLTTATSQSKKATTLAISNRSKIPNSNLKTKPVTTRPTSATKVETPATKNATTVTPTKKVNASLKPTTTNGRRGSLVSSTLASTSSKKLLNTTSKGGVIKSTPPVSVLTGRTRKPSRLSEKRPVITSPTEKIDIVPEEKEEEVVEEEEINTEVQDEITPSSPTTPKTTDTSKEIIKLEIAQEATCDNMIQQQQIVSYPSTCSSAATDEHDAEVAATTSKKDTIALEETETSFAPTTTTTTLPLLCNSGRSSFSPNSITSLTRPKTPEVDQLRLRFETIIQTSSPGAISSTQQPQDYFVPRRRPSSKLSQHEFASRIKDMKPRGPAGTRVKSMVELFMDENLNKWEF